MSHYAGDDRLHRDISPLIDTPTQAAPLTRAELENLKALADAETPLSGWSGDYIEAACEAVPRLIAEVRRMRELLRAVKHEVDADAGIRCLLCYETGSHCDECPAADIDAYLKDAGE